ncbi:MAG: plasmid pRiA4b ORF-3 family protein [Planctomycetaceae bacterium]
MMAKHSTVNVFVFKVALRYEPDIWRRIAIKGNQTLEDLHFAIFDAFNRDEEHLYSFYLPKPGNRSRFVEQNSTEYAHPMAVDEGFGDQKVYDASDTLIEELELSLRKKFYYLFDFGDSWWHTLDVEQIRGEVEKGKKYPLVIEEHGKAPPQYEWDDEEGDEDDEEDEDEE